MLARAGVDVLVLEKHGDFLRDFRGDTIHSSTMELMAEIGLAERVLQLRHSKASQLVIETPRERGHRRLQPARTAYPYLTFLPQWDFLDLLTTEAERQPSFRLLMNPEARELVVADGMVRGLRYAGDDGWQEVRALLTVAADGRDSQTRAQAGLEPVGVSPPMDVLWFRLSRREGPRPSRGA